MTAPQPEDLTQVPASELVARVQALGEQVDAIQAERETLNDELRRREQVKADARAALAAMEEEG